MCAVLLYKYYDGPNRSENRKREETENGPPCNDIILLFRRRRDCGEPACLGYCARKRCRRRRRLDRRPSDPLLYRAPHTRPVRRLAYIIVLLFSL